MAGAELFRTDHVSHLKRFPLNGCELPHFELVSPWQHLSLVVLL